MKECGQRDYPIESMNIAEGLWVVAPALAGRMLQGLVTEWLPMEVCGQDIEWLFAGDGFPKPGLRRQIGGG